MKKAATSLIGVLALAATSSAAIGQDQAAPTTAVNRFVEKRFN
jgi:hypothetical protein